MDITWYYRLGPVEHATRLQQLVRHLYDLALDVNALVDLQVVIRVVVTTIIILLLLQIAKVTMRAHAPVQHGLALGHILIRKLEQMLPVLAMQALLLMQIICE